MTWSMFAIGWLELNDTTKANGLFKKQFDNVNEPFKVWYTLQVKYFFVIGNFFRMCVDVIMLMHSYLLNLCRYSSFSMK